MAAAVAATPRIAATITAATRSTAAAATITRSGWAARPSGAAWAPGTRSPGTLGRGIRYATV